MGSVLTCSIGQENGVITSIKADLEVDTLVINSIDIRVKSEDHGDDYGVPEGMAAAMLHLMSVPADQVIFEERSAEIIFNLMEKYMTEEVAASWAVKQ